MQLEQSFEVAAPIEQVWRALIDVEHVAPCLPGASITGRDDDGGYRGAFSVKIGPTSASYTGKLEMEQVDDAAHTATMKAAGSDKRGQGGASATITSRLTELDPGRTRVQVDTDYRITGRLAQFGRGGMIQDIAEKLLRQFAENLEASLAAAPAPDRTEEGAPAAAGPGGAAGAAAPLDAGALVGGALLERGRRAPLPLAVALAAVLLLVWRRRRRA
jgi:carbon monoxide dehydrogenase subunit G